MRKYEVYVRKVQEYVVLITAEDAITAVQDVQEQALGTWKFMDEENIAHSADEIHDDGTRTEYVWLSEEAKRDIAGRLAGLSNVRA
jgi:hypothetical protein